ncbi:MAG: carbohydrate kinase family protein [Aggregatilineales bacterium]
MNIVVTGSIAYDYLMRFPGHFKDHLIPEELHQVSVSFLVEEMTKHWGGVAANIAYTLGVMGLQPKLMGTAGRDFPDYRNWLENVGVDTSTVRQLDHVFTASFFVNTDLDNNQIASFYAGAMSLAKDYSLQDALNGKPDLIVISPNDPGAMSNYAEESRKMGVRFIYDPSQQVARLSGEELKQDMQGAYAMFANAYEAKIICQKTGLTIDDLRKMVDVLVITQGPNGCHVYENGTLAEIPAFPTNIIKDPTGVGDAFRAGFIFGLSHEWDIELCAKVGSLCATYVLEQVGTQGHRYTTDEFIQRFRAEYDDGGKLNSML